MFPAHHDGAPFHRMLALGSSQGKFGSDFHDFYTGGKQRRIRGAQRIRIEPDAIADAARTCSPKTQMNGNGIVGVPRLYPNGRAHLPAAVLEVHKVLVLQAKPLRRSRTNNGGVVPGERGDGLGQLLEPAVVREAAIEYVRVGAENDFKSLSRRRPRRSRGRAFECHLSRGERAVRDHAIVDRFAPPILEIGARMLAVPVALHNLVWRLVGRLHSNAASSS